MKYRTVNIGVELEHFSFKCLHELQEIFLSGETQQLGHIRRYGPVCLA